MMTVKRFVCNPLGENCYVASDESHHGVIIDCGAFSPSEFAMIEKYIEEEGIIPERQLQTHMHFDHVFGLDFVFDRYGLRPECHEAEEVIYANNGKMALELCGIRLPQPSVGVGRHITDGETIHFGNTELKAIHTPGHTGGGLCFLSEADGVLFSGDTLFQGSIGRTDHATGNWQQEIDSIRTRIMPLPPETKVYPGHGPGTTLEYEARYNPYLR